MRSTDNFNSVPLTQFLSPSKTFKQIEEDHQKRSIVGLPESEKDKIIREQEQRIKSLEVELSTVKALLQSKRDECSKLKKIANAGSSKHNRNSSHTGAFPKFGLNQSKNSSLREIDELSVGESATAGQTPKDMGLQVKSK